MVALLEGAAAGAAAAGAERVFLRLADGCAAIALARRAGFFPCYGETLYRAAPVPSESSRGLFDADSRLRVRAPSDDYALFRLYNAAAPVSVRQMYGMTLEQWAASRERAPGRLRERVFDDAAELKGVVRTSAPRLGAAILDVELHPDYIALAPDFADCGLRELSGARSAMCVVPEYAPHMARALEARGFSAEARFAVLVKTMARRAAAVSKAALRLGQSIRP